MRRQNVRLMDSQRVKALAKRKKMKNPVKAMVACVSDLKAQHNILPSHPVDVWAMAANLEIPVTEEKLPSPGFLIQHYNGSFEIKIDSRMPIERRNFTIAHELGHFLFYTHIPEHIYNKSIDVEDPAEEYLCDIAAAEMLMPFELIKTVMKNKKFSPSFVFEQSRKLEVSRWALISRIRQVFNSSISSGDGKNRFIFVLWKKFEDVFYPEWCTPETAFPNPVYEHIPSSISRAYTDNQQSRQTQLFMLEDSTTTYNTISWKYGRKDRVLTLLWNGEAINLEEYIEDISNSSPQISKTSEAREKYLPIIKNILCPKPSITRS